MILTSSCSVEKRVHLKGYNVQWTGKTHHAHASRIKIDKVSDISSEPEFEINEPPFNSTTELIKRNDLLADKNNFQESKPEKLSHQLPIKSFKKEQVRLKYGKWKKRMLPKASEDNSSRSSGSSGNTLAILGLIFIVVGLLLLPFFAAGGFLSIAGGILSIIAWIKGSKMGKIVSIVFISISALIIILYLLWLDSDGGGNITLQ